MKQSIFLVSTRTAALISSNNIRGQLLLFSEQKGGDYYFFEFLLTGSLALNVLFYNIPLNQKYDHIKHTEQGIFKYSKFVP